MSFNIFLSILFAKKYKKAKMFEEKWSSAFEGFRRKTKEVEDLEQENNRLKFDLKREKENHIIQFESFYREPKEIMFSFCIPNEFERYTINEEFIRTNIMNKFIEYCRENYDDVFESKSEHDIIHLSDIVTARFRYIPTTGKYAERREKE
jgi:hypothetical protein